MTLRSILLATIVTRLVFPADGRAQVRVNPTGVNVTTQGATTVFLTYGGLRNQVAVEAFWCGSLISAAPARGSRCNPATIFGQLPIRYDQSRLSNGVLADVMSIPPSVSRRAYQDAARGNTSSFYYVRRFVSTTGGVDEYVAVTCRLAGGGARVPFSLTDVELRFEGNLPVLFVEPDATVAPLEASIAYTGTGRLRGRWEVVLPGDEQPGEQDLLTEATLPPEARGTQRRYTELGRFNLFLQPTGRIVVPGPDVSRIPTAASGTYLILLRVEATDDKEGDSDLSAAGAGTGVVHSGAVAGFPLPALRYVVGAAAGDVGTSQKGRELTLLLPRDAATVAGDSVVALSWLEDRRAAFYRVEFETNDGVPIFAAITPPTAAGYQAPPFLFERAGGKSIKWRVSALDFNGREAGRSRWRTMTARR